MKIRPATPKDAKEIATFLFQAMEEIIYRFIRVEDKTKALDFLSYFTQRENNQYSYENCTVMELNNKIIGVANVYNGADLLRLRKPIEEYIKSHFNINFKPEEETQAGEFYLDSFSIDTDFRGQGWGTKLLEYLIVEYCHHRKSVLGLWVEKDNPKAKKLYLKLGFKKVADKTLMGKTLEHLQIKK